MAVALMADIDELRNGWFRVEPIGDACLAKEAVYFGLRVLRDPGRLETFALLERTERFIGRADTKKFQMGQPRDCRERIERPDGGGPPGRVPAWKRR